MYSAKLFQLVAGGRRALTDPCETIYNSIGVYLLTRLEQNLSKLTRDVDNRPDRCQGIQSTLAPLDLDTGIIFWCLGVIRGGKCRSTTRSTTPFPTWQLGKY
jgi:hypothetical protein